MKVLHIVNTYADESNPAAEPFVRSQIESLRDQGVEVDVYNVKGNVSRLNYFKSMCSIGRRVKAGKYDLVHGHYVYSGWVGASQRIAPAIVSFMGSDLQGSFKSNGQITLQGWMDRGLSWAVQFRVRGIIVKSREMYGMLRARNKARIIPNGVDFGLFRPLDRDECRKKLGLNPSTKYVLFAHRPESENKGFDVINGAAELLKSRGEDVKILLAQGVSHETMVDYYNASDIVAMASIREGSPNVIKEAMACNRPLISTNVGDVKDVFGPTKGCLIARRTSEDFARAMDHIFRHFTETGGRDSIQHLSSERTAQNILDFYETILTDAKE